MLISFVNVDATNRRDVPFIGELSAKKLKGYFLEKDKSKGFSKDAKVMFCSRLRGWVLPSDELFKYLFKLVDKDVWDEKDRDFIEKWINKKLYYALLALFEKSESVHLNELKKMIVSKKNNLECMLPCSFSGYVDLLESIPKSKYNEAKELCKPTCNNADLLPSINGKEEILCECLVDENSEKCNQISKMEYYSVKESLRDQKTIIEDNSYMTESSIDLPEGELKDVYDSFVGSVMSM